MILIATRYMQKTSGDIPPQLTMFCSVVAAAADNSSYNIYIYGGYDGVNATYTTSDDVYVLSIPSFTWVKVYSGTSTHGRSVSRSDVCSWRDSSRGRYALFEGRDHPSLQSEYSPVPRLILINNMEPIQGALSCYSSDWRKVSYRPST
jgi:Kelch motif protein